MSRLPLLAALLAGCDPEAPPTDIAPLLTQTQGCADVLLFAYDADGTWLLRFQRDGLLEEMYATGDTGESETGSLPDEEVTLTLSRGSGLEQVPCNDVATDETVEETFTATAGAYRLALVTTSETWEPWSMPGEADLRLTDVVFTSEADGEEVGVSSLTIAESVGWLPG